MDKDFLYKLVEHGICQRVEILILVNQGYKLLRRFPALLIAGNGLFQFRDFRIESVLLFGILCVQGLIPGVRQLTQGIVLIDFANQLFQFPSPLLSNGQPFPLLGYVGGLLGGLCFLDGADKLSPVILGILCDGPEHIGKLKTIKAEHLQDYMDFLSFGGTNEDGTTANPLSVGSMRQYSAVLSNSFRFAVFPKQLITFNPMQYVVRRSNDEDYEMFAEDAEGEPLNETPTIDYQQYSELIELLKKKGNPALLPIQIAYFTGLRIGEACSLTWQDINLNEQCLTVRRSMRYNATRKKTEIGPTKRKKIRTVDFCDTLAAILRAAKKEQMLNSIKYGPLYRQNYYRIVKEKNRTYYEVYTLPRTEQAPEDYNLISFVCLRPEGAYESPATVSSVCRTSRKKLDNMDDFHFHQLRHTYTSNLLSGGAAPKDVQELLGHADVSTTMNIYAHATREAKRTSARLLDKVVGAV